MTVLISKFFPSSSAFGRHEPRPSFLARVAFWMERARSRRALATLNERQLKDIGLTAEDVETELQKPFWN
ncbi:MAG: DUF1127 domain-containing protein [Pseudomonadota bacterium]